MKDQLDTGFKDKTGRSIYIDDVLQHRLGKFGKKSGGPKTLRAIKYGKKYHLVSESHNDEKYGGVPLTEKLCENLVVIKSSHIQL